MLDRFIAPISEEVLASMESGERITLTNDGGDVIEAVGGIVHPWALEAKTLVREQLQEWGLALLDVENLRYALAMVVRRVKELLCYCYASKSGDAVTRVVEIADSEASSKTASETKRQRLQVGIVINQGLTSQEKRYRRSFFF